jgi:ABC-2 type transport system permease protein
MPERLVYPGRWVWFVRILQAFVRREIAEAARFRFAFLLRFLSFGVGVLSLYFFSRFVDAGQNDHLARYGGDYLSFGVIGLLAAELQQVGVSALALRVRLAQLMGYLEAQLATPAPAWMVLAAAPVYEFGVAALRSIVYLVAASTLLGVRFRPADPLAVLLAASLTVAAFAGLGLLTAALTMLVRRTNPTAIVLGALSVFLSGVVYPVTVLPPWLRAAGQLLPLTHALEALRGALLLRASVGDVGRPLAALAAFAAVLGPAGVALFVYALRRARIDGSLTHS